MIKPNLPMGIQQKYYVLDRTCLCGDRFVQQISMRYGSVLTFPLNIVWFYGQRQETLIEALTYRCYKCGQDHMAWKPEEVDKNVWQALYVDRCKELGVYDMDKDSAVNWPVLNREQAMRMAAEEIQRYGDEPSWYQAWANNPKTIHPIVDANGDIIAEAVAYGMAASIVEEVVPDITVYLEEQEFDWKGV